jgi:hypothetical protein
VRSRPLSVGVDATAKGRRRDGWSERRRDGMTRGDVALCLPERNRSEVGLGATRIWRGAGAGSVRGWCGAGVGTTRGAREGVLVQCDTDTRVERCGVLGRHSVEYLACMLVAGLGRKMMSSEGLCWRRKKAVGRLA